MLIKLFWRSFRKWFLITFWVFLFIASCVTALIFPIGAKAATEPRYCVLAGPVDSHAYDPMRLTLSEYGDLAEVVSGKRYAVLFLPMGDCR